MRINTIGFFLAQKLVQNDKLEDCSNLIHELIVDFFIKDLINNYIFLIHLSFTAKGAKVLRKGRKESNFRFLTFLILTLVSVIEHVAYVILSAVKNLHAH